MIGLRPMDRKKNIANLSDLDKAYSNRKVWGIIYKSYFALADGFM